jgi:hypothetical protein
MKRIDIPAKSGIRPLFRSAWVVLFLIATAICFPKAIYAEEAYINDVPAKPAAPATEIASPTSYFTISPQPLVTALDHFGEKTGVHIFYSSRLTKGLVSLGATGFLTTNEALQMLLAGTPLSSVATGPNEITLVLNPELATSANIVPIRAPILPLHTMQVDVPSLADFRLYASTVQYSVLNALRTDPKLRGRRFRAIVDVWLSPAGNVRRLELQVPSGDADIDLAIVRNVRRIAIGRSPPVELPQPVHVKLLTASAQQRMAE